MNCKIINSQQTLEFSNVKNYQYAGLISYNRVNFNFVLWPWSFFLFSMGLFLYALFKDVKNLLLPSVIIFAVFSFLMLLILFIVLYYIRLSFKSFLDNINEVISINNSMIVFVKKGEVKKYYSSNFTIFKNDKELIAYANEDLEEVPSSFKTDKKIKLKARIYLNFLVKSKLALNYDDLQEFHSVERVFIKNYMSKRLKKGLGSVWK